MKKIVALLVIAVSLNHSSVQAMMNQNQQQSRCSKPAKMSMLVVGTMGLVFLATELIGTSSPSQPLCTKLTVYDCGICSASKFTSICDTKEDITQAVQVVCPKSKLNITTAPCGTECTWTPCQETPCSNTLPSIQDNLITVCKALGHSTVNRLQKLLGKQS